MQDQNPLSCRKKASQEIYRTVGDTNPNFTVIVNWKAKGFGCSSSCSYCNWSVSPMLPQGPQSSSTVREFIRQCRKSFVTISGGGDPMYKFNVHKATLHSMAETIKREGYKVRVITREVQHVGELKGIADHVSISLDDDVLQSLDAYRDQWAAMDVEFSLVLPPLPTAQLVALKPQYAALHKRLGRRLVLRENFNSIFPASPALISFGHTGIVFVPKSLCLNSRYLSTIDCTGHDIVQDNAALAGYLMNDPNVVLFGGFVKHLLDPVVHLEYSDIDFVALDTGVMNSLAQNFGYSFKEVSPDTAYPRYFMGKSMRAGKSLQVVLMQSLADAERFIFNAQYYVDRVAYRQGLIFEQATDETAIRQDVHTKTARLVQGARDMHLFHSDRRQIEQRHRAKLIKKGFTVI